MSAEGSKKSLKIGVLFVAPVQFLDVGPIDLFGMLTAEYLKSLQLPEPVVALAPEIEILYISAAENDGFTPLSASAGLRITHTLTTAPEVDILHIPGPEPSYQIKPSVADYICAHIAAGRTLLAVCTGVLPTLMSGVLAGQRATAPLGLLPMLRQKAPNVHWTERRWEENEGGNIWTSGGVTNGLDMVAAYLKKHFAPQLVAIVCATADVGDRKQEYGEETKQALAKLSI